MLQEEKKNYGQNEVADNIAESTAADVPSSEEPERSSEQDDANEKIINDMQNTREASTLETIQEENNDNLEEEIEEGEMCEDDNNDTDTEHQELEHPMEIETIKKRKTSTPRKAAKKSKKENFSDSEMASLMEEVKQSDVKMVQQQRKQQVKDSDKLFQNTKTLNDVLGKTSKRGPKAGKPKNPVTDHEKSQRAFVNSLLLMKKTDPAFNFNVNLTF